MSDLHDLILLLNSDLPLVVVESSAETHCLDLVKQAGQKRFKPTFVWSVTQGFRRLDLSLADDKPFGELVTDDVDAALAAMHHYSIPSIFILCDLHPYLVEDRPKTIRHLKDLALHPKAQRHHIILLSHRLTLPPELKPFAAQLHMRLPTDAQLLQWLREAARTLVAKTIRAKK